MIAGIITLVILNRNGIDACLKNLLITSHVFRRSENNIFLTFILNPDSPGIFSSHARLLRQQ